MKKMTEVVWFVGYMLLVAAGFFANRRGFDVTVIQMVLLVVGFVMLIKGADYFVDGASGIADKFGIPQIIIGLTIVAFGTSAPEAAISISSAIKGSTGLAIGNVVGSNIMNILLILGLTATIIKLNVGTTTVYIEMPYVIFITAVMVVMGAVNGELGFFSGVILWGLFILFFIYLIVMAKKGMAEAKETSQQVDGNGQNRKQINKEEQDRKEAASSGKKTSILLLLVMTLMGMAGIVIGSDVTVDSASFIATRFGMSERLIGLTIVAFGTSLPELVTSVMAAIKGNADIAVGNIVGSNIFNILFVLGTTALIQTVTYEKAFVFDGIIAIAAAVLLFLCVLRKKQLGRAGGIVMLLGYAAYLTVTLM